MDAYQFQLNGSGILGDCTPAWTFAIVATILILATLFLAKYQNGWQPIVFQIVITILCTALLLWLCGYGNIGTGAAWGISILFILCNFAGLVGNAYATIGEVANLLNFGTTA